MQIYCKKSKVGETLNNMQSKWWRKISGLFAVVSQNSTITYTIVSNVTSC